MQILGVKKAAAFQFSMLSSRYRSSMIKQHAYALICLNLHCTEALSVMEECDLLFIQ